MWWIVKNSDPYKLYATLNNLNQEALLNKICKIILYDDIHTTSAWKILERFTQIPIEHVLIERIKENKSLVDIRLTTGTCREYYPVSYTHLTLPTILRV